LSGKVCADIQRLPLASAVFDLVSANMVIEHVSAPERLFAEVARVLRPGGRFLVHTPNATGYTTRLTKLIPPPLRPRVARLLQGRQADDVYPTHYRANTRDALHSLARASGFEVAALETINSSPQLYRVPVLGRLEDQWLRLLRSRAASLRPCILAVFVNRPSSSPRSASRSRRS
jgi:SAM-dependent methyltransferase